LQYRLIILVKSLWLVEEYDNFDLNLWKFNKNIDKYIEIHSKLTVYPILSVIKDII